MTNSLNEVSLIPYNQKRLTISKWADQDKPREKLMALGPRALTDAELLTILICNGTRNKTAFDLAMELLVLADNNLHKLSKFTLAKFYSIQGIGPAKAIAIKTALELAARVQEVEINYEDGLLCSSDLFNYFRKDLYFLDQEEFWILILDKKMRPIIKKRLGTGTANAVQVDLVELGKYICENKGYGLACAHNHPSGAMEQSRQDEMLTKKIMDICTLFGCKFIDHIIISNNLYFSFSDKNLL